MVHNEDHNREQPETEEDIPQDEMTGIEGEIVSRTEATLCLLCGFNLRVYKTERRTVKSVHDSFDAVHRIRKCRRIFRSEKLEGLTGPCRSYANDVTVDAAMKRFIEGRSCPEITPFTEISERQARDLSNVALGIMAYIHEERLPKFGKAIQSYTLLINGTVGSNLQ